MEFDKQEQRTKEFQPVEPSHLDERAIPVVPPVLAYLGVGADSAQEMQLDQLVAALAQQDWVGRVATVRKLGKLKQRAPVECLCTVLQQDEHQAVRAAAAQALGMIRAGSAIVPLIASLQDSSWHVRTAAVTALGKQRELVPAEPLIAALADEDDSVRTAAAWAIGQLGSRAPITPLAASLHDPSWQVRESAARSLGRLGTQPAREPLLAVLQDQDEAVRVAAAWALQQIDDVPEPVREENGHDRRDIVSTSQTAIHPLPHWSQQRDRATGELRGGKVVPMYERSKRRNERGEEGRRSKPRPSSSSRGASLLQIIERSLVAALIAAIGLSWLLVSHWPGTTTGSGNTSENAATVFSYQMPSGTATHLAWAVPSVTHGANNLVAFATNNGWIQVWNTATSTLVTTYGPFQRVLALNWPASGLQIATLTSDGRLQLIAGENMQPMFSLPSAHSASPLVSLSPDGKRIAIATQTGHRDAITVWTLATHASIVVHPSQPGEITSLAWSSDNAELAAASDNGEMRTIDLWNVMRGTSIADPLAVPYVPVPFRVLNMAWSSDNVHLAYALDDGEVRVWDRRSYNHLLFHSTSDQSAPSNATWSAVVAWSPDGKHVATTTQHGLIQIWDATTGDLLSTYQGHHQQINALSWSSDGKRISSASADGLVLVWNVS